MLTGDVEIKISENQCYWLLKCGTLIVDGYAYEKCTDRTLEKGEKTAFFMSFSKKNPSLLKMFGMKFYKDLERRG